MQMTRTAVEQCCGSEVSKCVSMSGEMSYSQQDHRTLVLLGTFTSDAFKLMS